MNRPLLHRPEEVAEMLRLGRTRVYGWMATGELYSIKIGRSRRIPDDAVRQFIERLTVASATSAPQNQSAPGELGQQHEPAQQPTERPPAASAPQAPGKNPKVVRRRPLKSRQANGDGSNPA